MSRTSSQKVTGPSLISATCMSAPKTPVDTGFPIAIDILCTNCSNRGCETSPRAAIITAFAGEEDAEHDGNDTANRRGEDGEHGHVAPFDLNLRAEAAKFDQQRERQDARRQMHGDGMKSAEEECGSRGLVALRQFIKIGRP